MRHLRRHRSALAALLCAGIATVLVLLAIDARTWQTTVARDDIRFRVLPTHRGLWQPKTILPGDPASLVVGTGGTMAYRRALQYFWYSRIGTNPDVREDPPTLRATAQAKLQQLITSAPTAAERSEAANLLGVLVVTTPAPGNDENAIALILTRAASYFQQAIAIAPGNADAKQNLELVLRVTRPGKGKLGQDARRGYGFGRGNAIGEPGGGY